MWDFDSLKASEDEAAGEAPLVYNFLDGAACVRIKAQLHPEENRPEDTSQIVWPAARALSAHLERECLECRPGAVGARPRGTGDTPEGRDVLELGAGMGLVGFAALAMGARSVVLTDVDRVLPALSHNAELNDNAGPGSVDVMELDFRKVAREGLPEFPRTSMQRDLVRFDLVVCSDCVLWPELRQPLLSTLEQLLDSENAALISMVHRNAQAGLFLEVLKEQFQVEDIPVPQLEPQTDIEALARIQIVRVRRREKAVSEPMYKESRLDVSLASRGGKSTIKTGEGATQMSTETAHAIVDELLSKYSDEGFQAKLYKAWEAAKGDPQKEQAARRKVCLEIQGPIMLKHGFEDSMEGVINCLAHFYFPPLCLDTNLNKKIAHTMLQTKPWFQTEQRLHARVRVWSGETCRCQLIADLVQSVKALKMDVELQTGIPWLAQRLRSGECDLPDYWKLEFFVPRDSSEAVDLLLETRDDEKVTWLMRLNESSDIKRQEACLQDAPPELMGDAEFVHQACQISRIALKHAEVGLRYCREIVFAAVHHSWLALKYASSELQADWEVVMAAISSHTGNGSGMALQFASPSLCSDPNIVVAAITSDAWAIQFLPEASRHDKGVALLALRRDGLVLPELPQELKDDPEVVLAAVHQNGRVLQSVSPRLQANPEIVRAAVGQCPDALQFAASKLRSDRSIVLTAVRGNGEMYRFAAPKLQADREVALAAVCSRGCMIAHVPRALYDLEMALAAVKQNPTAIEFLDETLTNEVKDLQGDAAEAEAALRRAEDEARRRRAKDEASRRSADEARRRSAEEEARKEAQRKLAEAMKVKALPVLTAASILQLKVIQQRGIVEVVTHSAESRLQPKPSPGERIIITSRNKDIGKHGTILQPAEAGSWRVRMDDRSLLTLSTQNITMAPPPLATIVLKKEIDFKPVHHGDPITTVYSHPMEAKQFLDDLALVLRIYDSVLVSIEGHTATPKEKMDDWSFRLAQSRADEIREALIRAGIDGDRLKPIGLPGHHGSGKHDMVMKVVSL